MMDVNNKCGDIVVDHNDGHRASYNLSKFMTPRQVFIDGCDILSKQKLLGVLLVSEKGQLALLGSLQIHRLPVVSSTGVVVGIITRTDIFEPLMPKNLNPLHKSVGPKIHRSFE